MERDRRPDRRGALPDPPSRVEVTVLRGPPASPQRTARAMRRTIAATARSRAVMGLATAMLAAAALAVILSAPWSTARPETPAGTAPRVALSAGATSEPQSVTQMVAVYRYPLGCMSPTVSIAEGAKLARVRHSGPCRRYGVFVTAILRRRASQWRLALEAISRSCPAALLHRASPCRHPLRFPRIP